MPLDIIGCEIFPYFLCIDTIKDSCNDMIIFLHAKCNCFRVVFNEFSMHARTLLCAAVPNTSLIGQKKTNVTICGFDNA